jgi:hypothetical protein
LWHVPRGRDLSVNEKLKEALAGALYVCDQLNEEVTELGGRVYLDERTAVGIKYLRGREALSSTESPRVVEGEEE